MDPGAGKGADEPTTNRHFVGDEELSANPVERTVVGELRKRVYIVVDGEHTPPGSAALHFKYFSSASTSKRRSFSYELVLS